MLDEVGLIQLALVLILQALHVDPAALIGLPSISLENISANLPFLHVPLLPGHVSITTVKELQGNCLPSINQKQCVLKRPLDCLLVTATPIEVGRITLIRHIQITLYIIGTFQPVLLV